jgi:hypothetical protein
MMACDALVRSLHPQSPQSHIARCNVQRAAISTARVTVEATELGEWWGIERGRARARDPPASGWDPVPLRN